MSDMADFCNEYQDGTMEEYYDYFSGNIHMPDYEQQPHADQGLQVGLLRWRSFTGVIKPLSTKI